MNGIDQMVGTAITNITGLSVDITTVAIGCIIIIVLLAGLDLILVSVGFNSQDFLSSGKKGKKKEPFSAKENEDSYKEYSRKKYWQEQYKDRYTREFK